MTLDQYQQCPGGLDKKIKFCCKDLVGELDKISRSVEGQQYEAALRQIDRSLVEHPDRQCLCAIKCTILIQTGQVEKAKTAVQDFLRIAPENPIGLAEAAVLAATSPNVTPEMEPEEAARQRELALQQSVRLLHESLVHCDSHLPAQVYEAIGLVGQFLIELGYVLAGREHLLFHYAISDDTPERTTQLLMETGQSNDIPLLMKQETSLPKPADWVQWKEDYIAARELALGGAWTQAAEQIEALILAHEPHPVLLEAHAALRCRLPDLKKAAEALQAVAACKDIELERAAECAALAQILAASEGQGRDELDIVKLTFPVSNADLLMEQLLSDRHAQTMNIDLASLSTEDQPPPKAAFNLLDRELPVSGRDITEAAVPLSLCELLLYGKQTDREARLETIVTRNQLPQVTERIQQIGQDSISGNAAEEVLGQTSEAHEQMSARPHFPKDTPPEFRSQYLSDLQKKLLLDRWPHLKDPSLDNHTPAEVAGDPRYLPRLLGTMLVLECVNARKTDAECFAMLRKQLQLPERVPIKVNREQALALPLMRLPYVELSSVEDNVLALLFVRASQSGVARAIMRFGEEMLRRESMTGHIDKAEVLARMSQYAPDTRIAVELLQQAQVASREKGDSPAMWMVSELSLRLLRGEGDEAQALLNRLQTHHIQEPGIAQLLMQTLQRFGLVSPNGTPPPPPTAAAVGPAAAPAAATQRLWTPDGGGTAEPAAGADQGKSKLWVPGME